MGERPDQQIWALELMTKPVAESYEILCQLHSIARKKRSDRQVQK